MSDLLPWVLAASRPWVDWLFADVGRARAALQSWMRRPSSEVFAGRVVRLVDGDQTLGGYIAVPGSDLSRYRMADAVAAAQAAGREGRYEMSRRLQAGTELFSEPHEDELYLSRIGVLPEARRSGHGSRLLHDCVDGAVRGGSRRVRLDVWEGNTAAVAFYRAHRFRELDRRTSRAAGLTYLSFGFELDA
jgi:ribosomal-protein-alanine N-acetyltransferase